MDPCEAQQNAYNAAVQLQFQLATVVQGIAALQAQLMMLQAAALNAKGLADQQVMVTGAALQQCRNQNP